MPSGSQVKLSFLVQSGGHLLTKTRGSEESRVSVWFSGETERADQRNLAGQVQRVLEGSVTMNLHGKTWCHPTNPVRTRKKKAELDSSVAWVL